ncbi:MAG: hypothetical protein M3R21_00455 [Candidatus Dormibacteraeota bacterium]|nr:hypothetical protein [Candidatus Dormibacteraeota bacterium]
MNGLRKAHSVAGAVLMLQFLLQFYFIAAAAVTIFSASQSSHTRAFRFGRACMV